MSPKPRITLAGVAFVVAISLCLIAVVLLLFSKGPIQ